MRLPLDLPAPGSQPFDVVGFGVNSVDLLVVVRQHPRPNTKQRLVRFARLPGGQAATAMATCARLGWRTRYIGRFGDDEHGRMGQRSLEVAGVDVSACQVVAGASNQFAVILVDERSGERTIMWDRDPALTISPEDVPRDAVSTGRILLVDCLEIQAATTAARYARQAGMRTVVDVERVRPGIEGLLREIDVIIAAQEFPTELTGASLGAGLRQMADQFGAAVVCVTLGSEGSLAVAQGCEIRTPAFRVVPVVDTTGAGDVFRGGFVAGWLAGGPHADLEDVLRFANATAGLKCRRLGAREGIPTLAQVEELLAGQSR